MTPVCVMAGGRGLRLHPLTEHRPKPLLPVGGKPILEQIIDRFASQGFKRFWLSVNYRADLIKDYFGDGGSRGLKIRYLEEDQPLGTAGALSLLPDDLDVPIIVTNGDVLAEIDYAKLMEHHARSNANATVCLALWQTQIPFGVADVEDETGLVRLREKPIEDFLVNAGIYVLEPSVVRGIEANKPTNMTDLLDTLDTVSGYPIEGYWTDVGSWEDYARANGEWRGQGAS